MNQRTKRTRPVHGPRVSRSFTGCAFGESSVHARVSGDTTAASAENGIRRTRRPRSDAPPTCPPVPAAGEGLVRPAPLTEHGDSRTGWAGHGLGHGDALVARTLAGAGGT